jgi:hypothetical protein
LLRLQHAVAPVRRPPQHTAAAQETTTAATTATVETTTATDGAPVILSKGPNGEDAVSATTLGLTPDEIAKVKAGN